MKHQPLTAHPDFPPPAGVAVSAGWVVSDGGTLTLEYSVAGPGDAILWPAPASGRTDGLWKHSCFEAFIGAASGSAYAEFNLAPSGAWASYLFDGYRTGMRDLALVRPPVIAQLAPQLWNAAIDLAGIETFIGTAPWRLAVTAVIEAEGGRKSYWSLSHPPGKPDFHHADCFAARLG